MIDKPTTISNYHFLRVVIRSFEPWSTTHDLITNYQYHFTNTFPLQI